MFNETTQVKDIMSYGVQTVDASTRIGDLIAKLRRIGHEGYPVLQDNRVVGLLTARDANRAAEHGLNDLRVRDVMVEGHITVRKETSIQALLLRFAESGWWQIPVVSTSNRLIGIVTRTDLLMYMASQLQKPPETRQVVTTEQVETVLGANIARLIETISERARKKNLALYMVGGVVRDLLLGRENLDLDFVVEGNAIEFAETIASAYGGEIHKFVPFGTAKWDLATATDLDLDDLPHHIDFATARYEFYEEPTALPTVYESGIKLDLRRRDFTINALAVQLSPHQTSGNIIDLFGGLKDLHSQEIRVLHSLSFADDPTRTLRAVRFAHRLGFRIEPRTEELIASALPMMGQITGERLRNELTLILHEPEPEKALLWLQALKVPEAIHPTFVVDQRVPYCFEKARETPPFDVQASAVDLYWHILGILSPDWPALAERLIFPKRMAQSIMEAANLFENADHILESTPDVITQKLESTSELAYFTLWIMLDDPTQRKQVEHFVSTWRHIQPTTTGDTLRAMGLKPGPLFGKILYRLRVARINGKITTDAQETALLNKLIHQEDDRST